MSKIIHISQKSDDKLNQFEKEIGCSKQVIIEQAIEKLSRERFMQDVCSSL